MKFLRLVWSLQPDDGTYAFLSTKDWDTGTWADHANDPRFPEPDDLIGDLYFSPHLFMDTRRTRRNSAPTGRWLYADLDEVDPTGITPPPTIAWETSPGRYQALWLLDRPIPRRRLEKLNQALTYYTGADKGGWSLTKVLRVPGSVSHKRDVSFKVRLVMSERNVHAVTDMTELLRDVNTSTSAASIGSAPSEASLPKFTPTMRKHRKHMTARTRQLINTTTVLNSDDRSARLWELETSLLNASLKPDEVLTIVRATVWNKYTGQRRETEMLWREITKANAVIQAVPRPKDKDPQSSVKGLLPNSLMYDDFMRKDWERPTWLIDHVWTAGAYGILAGEYKSFKTMLLLDMALSVASGEQFLGKHPVIDPGMVAYIHEEGRPWSIHDRLHRVAHMKGLTDTYDPNADEIVFGGRSLPICVTSLPGINLRDDDDMASISKHIATLKPKLVILETFYLLAGGVTESNIEEVSPILEFLAGLSHEYKCAVILSHHFHKSSDDRRFLDRVAGSNIFGRWYESGMFVERHGPEEDNTIQVMSHHRDGSGTRARLQLVWGEEDDADASYFNINHLPIDDDEDAAAQTIVDMGSASTRQLAPFDDDATLEEAAAAQRKPFFVEDLSRALGMSNTTTTTQHLKRLGYTITTKPRDGKPRRYATPSPEDED